MDTIPRGNQIYADLLQVRPETFTFGRLIYGTLTSGDKGFFDSVAIPSLMANNGSKTGVVLGCEVQINVPIASPVTDDNVDQGPLRIKLLGTIEGPFTIKGDAAMSRLIMQGEEMPPKTRHFAWIAQQQ